MRVRVATTALGITAALLALPACSPDTTGPKHQPSSRTGKPTEAAQEPAALSSATLESRLLDPRDLGSGYLPKPERPAQHDDVTVTGCPALSELGGDAATGGTLAFPHKAEVDFTYGGSSSEISEELYSDSTKKLSDGVGRIFDAMAGCPAYQVVSGGTPVDVSSQKLPAPTVGGDERWSLLLTFIAGGRSTVVKQTAIRDGNLLLVVSGSPALVDRHLDKALAKATATS
ncbi:Sensor domain-containing protein OS=Streptomyces tendae OX=1932 GN=GUR47_19470 PE=4 SV=1 [Streptomyces tendae]